MIQLRDFSWSVLFIWLALAVIGLIAIYSATLGPVSEFLPSYIQNNFSRQLLWISISIVVLVSLLFTSPRTFQGLAYPFYAVVILLMIVTLFFGTEVSGSKSWLRIGPINMQTGILMLPATILAVSNYLTDRRDMTTENLKTALTTLLFFLVPIVLLILQNEAGLAVIYMGLLPVVLFWSGLPYGLSLLIISPAIIGYFTILEWYFGLIAVIIVSIAVFLLQKRAWLSFSTLLLGLVVLIGVELALTQILQPHQAARVEAFANPALDPQGAGWNVLQAKTAIGSGGFYGKGFTEGTQTQLRFLPEQWTDFVYCVIGEEFGFVGASTVLLLFLALFMRLINIAGSHKHPFAQLVIVSVTFVYFIQFLINVGSATSVLPVIGIPLPFVSYGGSAFLVNTAMLAICLNLDLYKRSFSIYR
ncbi:MAG: FtsW/RodA/SpoVE family cell cycle protein [Balneolaceae bacterium]